MPKHEAILNFSSVSDTQFRTWGKAISDALNLVGLTRTADTGQIDWATAVRSTAAGEQIVGYEMWSFNDSLAAAAPVFIKIEYGTANFRNASTGVIYPTPCIYVTTGTSSNGAGTLATIGTNTRARFVGSSATLNVGLGTPDGPADLDALSTCLFHSDGSTLFIGLGIQALRQGRTALFVNGNYSVAAGFPAMLFIERSRDTNGAPNGSGSLMATSRWQVNNQYQAHNGVWTPVYTWQITSYTGQNIGPLDSRWYLTWPGQGYSTGVFGSDLYVYPGHISTPQAHAQMLGVLGSYKNDLAIASEILIPVSGQPRNYRFIGGIGGQTDNDNSRSHVHHEVTNGALLLRWE